MHFLLYFFSVIQVFVGKYSLVRKVQPARLLMSAYQCQLLMPATNASYLEKVPYGKGSWQTLFLPPSFAS